jgi:hypothetical protein
LANGEALSTTTIKYSSMELDEEDMINSGSQPQAGPSTSTGDAEAPLSKKAIKRAAKQVRPSASY